MRKIWLWSLVAGVVFLSGCGVLPQKEKVLSGDVSQMGNETGVSPAEALSWKEAKLTLAEVQAQTGDTTPIVVITEANSGAIVTQTGDSLIYRNEVYGFQVKLGKAWKGGQIGVAQTSEAASIQETYIIFNLPYDRKGGIPNAGAISGMDRNSIWVGQIIIQSYENHEKTENYIANLHKGKAYDAFFDEETYSSVLWKNNQYYFLGRPLSQKELELLFAWEYRKRDKDIFETLEIFDIKDIEE